LSAYPPEVRLGFRQEFGISPQLAPLGTGARFGDSFGLGREALLMGHNCPVFDRCQPA